MVSIKVSREIPASLDKVWGIISDIDNEPSYWHGTKSVKNIHKDGNTVEREIVIAFRESKCRELVVLDPKKSVKANIFDGIMRGTEKNIIVNSNGADKTKIDVVWNLRISGFKKVFAMMIRKHIRQGTEDALTRIANTAAA
ncbi:MAG TPA: SRPBCC family protein [Nitrososphaeraceae archaeon]|nr:SRPBCC family protein [Nitrososphaeraceae archaeon]